MTPITFKDFRARLRAEIWPGLSGNGGEAKSLRASHDAYFQEILLKLGKHVKGLVTHNVSVWPACKCYVQRGATATDAPPGQIEYVYTIVNDDWNTPVYYHKVNFNEILTWQRRLTSFRASPANAGMTALQSGFKFHEASMDSEFGRAKAGRFAIHRNRLYLTPWIQSNEKIIVEWDGPRKEWQDDDILDLEYWNREVAAIIKLYVQFCHERDFGSDKQAMKIYDEDFRRSYADLICEAEKRYREDISPRVDLINQARTPTAAEINSEAVPSTVTPASSFVFANVGDIGGYASPPAEKRLIADLVKSWDDGPNFIVTANGDSSQYDDADNFQQSVGAYYGHFVVDTPSMNRFWPAIGNHDYSGNGIGNLDAYFAYFQALENRRWYNLVWGPAEFFFLNASSKLGTWPETSKFKDSNGNWIGQALWLKDALARSVSKWKIVIQHIPQYSSTADHDWTDVRFPASWGMDLIIGGHAHNYERGYLDGVHYIVNGAGGTSLVDFDSPTQEPTTVYKEKTYGALKGEVSCTSLKMQFYNSAGEVRDTLELYK